MAAVKHRTPFAAKSKRTVAMEPAIYQRLSEVAEAEKRSISSQIEAFIEEGIARWNREHAERLTPNSSVETAQ